MQERKNDYKVKKNISKNTESKQKAAKDKNKNNIKKLPETHIHSLFKQVEKRRW
jgi:hypothetical protein